MQWGVIFPKQKEGKSLWDCEVTEFETKNLLMSRRCQLTICSVCVCVFLMHFVSPAVMMQIAKYLNYCWNNVYHTQIIPILGWFDSKQGKLFSHAILYPHELAESMQEGKGSRTCDGRRGSECLTPGLCDWMKAQSRT